MNTKGYTLTCLMLVCILISCSPRLSTTGKKEELKVMTYNVHHCNPPARPGVIDVDAIAAVIRKENADLVALQEIDIDTKRSGYSNQAAQIALKAGYPSFYFAKAIDFDGGQYGVAILSKYPLSATQTHKLPTDETTNGEHRVLATATVTLPDAKTLVFACTHLDAQRSDINRELQIKEITRLTNAMTGPVLIGGDFNASEGSQVIRQLDENFRRTCQSCSGSFGGKEEAIDFIAFRPAANFTIVQHKVVQDTSASDHLPVVSLLKLSW